MLRGLWRLTWLEIKIFLREPLGAIGTLVFPVLIFVLFGKMGGGRPSGARAADAELRRRGSPDLRVDHDRVERGDVAGDGRRDLSRRRHPETPARDADAAAHHPDRARAGQAGVHAGHDARADRRRPADPAAATGRADPVVLAGGPLQHAEHPRPRLRPRQHRPGRPVRAADRRAAVLSDAGTVRPVLPGRGAPANAAAWSRGRCR